MRHRFARTESSAGASCNSAPFLAIAAARPRRIKRRTRDGYFSRISRRAIRGRLSGIFLGRHYRHLERGARQELISQPLAVFGITGLALVALWCRLRSNAIGPAIATHFAYNAVIVLAVLCFNWFSGLFPRDLHRRHRPHPQKRVAQGDVAFDFVHVGIGFEFFPDREVFRLVQGHAAE